MRGSESERKAIRAIRRLPEGRDKVTFGVAGALALAFVIFVLWLALGRFGNIPLGRDGE